MASTCSGQNGDCNNNRSFMQLLPRDCDDFGEPEILPQMLSDYSGASDEFGEPGITPRIGDEYQVDVTSLIKHSSVFSYVRYHLDLETSSHQNMLVGLPIKLTWICSMTSKALESHRSLKAISDFRCVDKIEPCGEHFHKQWKPLAKLKEKLDERGDQNYILVPGRYSQDWSDDEKDSFLLALYIFKKNFFEVRRFLETKEMGVILSFYYGKFYGSKDYIRWSECRKVKSKKCVYGQKIFSGLRQQELLSRLLRTVSMECQVALLEVSKIFSDEKMSLVDYVSSLKAMVGTNALVKAVGIGTGKQDLTRMATEPSKSNQVISAPHDLPTGKEFAYLTSREIIKFLTGDYRLSKARSNDLFWEAVWPLLLARGWHSEQPKNKELVTSKNCLVFLTPGVKKFSRRKLVKGDQYFDSVADVLSKVAREPGLIELDISEDDVNKKKESDMGINERELRKEEKSTSQCHFYLQRQTSNIFTHMKFTVIDTSLSRGAAVRKLRTLPSELSSVLTSQDYSGDSDKDTSEEITEEFDTINTIPHEVSATDKISSLRTIKLRGKMLDDMNENESSSSHQCTPSVFLDNVCRSLTKMKSKKDLHENDIPAKVSKRKGNEDYAPSFTRRRRRLSACSHEETSDCDICSSTDPDMKNDISSGCADISEFNENISSYVSSSQDKFSSTMSSKCSPSNSVGCTQALIDLNMPQAFPEYEHVIFTTESRKEVATNILKPDHCLRNSFNIEVKAEQQSVVNPRRQSTRNRPPTTRALEALANGYLTVNRKCKGKGIIRSPEVLEFRPSHHDSVAVSETPSCYLPSPMKEPENDLSSTGNCQRVDSFQVLPEENNKAVSGK